MKLKYPQPQELGVALKCPPPSYHLQAFQVCQLRENAYPLIAGFPPIRPGLIIIRESNACICCSFITELNKKTAVKQLRNCGYIFKVKVLIAEAVSTVQVHDRAFLSGQAATKEQ